jgi:prepilin-type N-terminal cleavage/methylation domain-containing protein
LAKRLILPVKDGSRFPGCINFKIMKTPEKIRTARGFTLVELIIVIALIGVLSTVAVFAWHGFRDNANLRTAARDIATNISASKQRAVTEGIQYRLTFSAGGNSYTIAADPFTPALTRTMLLADFGPGLTIVSTNFTLGQLTLLPRGTLSGATGRVIVGNGRGSQATITTNVTGKTHVQFAML